MKYPGSLTIRPIVIMAGLLCLALSSACTVPTPTAAPLVVSTRTEPAPPPTATARAATAAPEVKPTPTAPPTQLPTQPPTQPPPTAVPTASWKTYANSGFKLSFRYPAAWLGPDEYTADQTLRLEVGSDKVYPYGTDRTERVYTVKDAYYVLVQYTRNQRSLSLEQYRKDQPWLDSYFSLFNLADGQSRSTARDQVTRVRKVKVGNFEGLEWIATLAPTAQTEFFYSRQVILIDDKVNVVTITGSPNNVDAGGGSLAEAFRRVDEANLSAFRQIVESLLIQ